MSSPAPAAFEVDFRLPSDFREILTGASAEEAAAAVAARLGPDALATVPAARLDAAVAEYLAASELLEQEGVFYAAGCLGLLDGELTLSSLTLARIEADCADPGTAVEGVVRIRRRGQGSDRRTADRYDLPAGPAAVVIESSTGLLLPAADLGAPADLPLPVATLQAYLPVPRAVDPAGRTMLVVTFSTPSVRHWDAYCPVLADLLRSLRFPAVEAEAAAAVTPPAPTAPGPTVPAPAVPAPARSAIRSALG
ncbi:hypothetical protein [Streptacidiphilus cavernicola]|uniref:Uncharacterized protein n=1 Tax=Streptacidiphilus cavernicola TaxID=3342716 RepID=A0ABV6W2I5_9ACTN